MNENDRPGSGIEPRSPFASGGTGLEGRVKEEGSEAKAKLSEASRTVQNEAKELGAQAQRLAGEQAEKAKEAAASHLDLFADALRAASDELGRNQSGPAAEMVSSAASGLEGLTRSLHGKSTGEMIDTVRRFGRENPVGFLAGSVLAGLALGRFASVATSTPAPTTAATPAEPSGIYGGAARPVASVSPAASSTRTAGWEDNR